MYKSELEDVLSRHLAKVEAPEGLWDRIQLQARMPVPQKLTRIPVLFALAAMVMITVVVFHPRTVEVEYRLPQHNLTLRLSKSTQASEALSGACLLCHTGV